MFNGQGYGMSTTVDTKFSQDILHVEFHSAFTDVEQYRNIPIAFAEHYFLQYLFFPFCQTRGRLWFRLQSNKGIMKIWCDFVN